MSIGPSLIRMVHWARQLVAEAVGPGDLAVDLTAGNGRDSLHLYHCVGPSGRVLAFDIQEPALRQSAARLEQAGAAVDFWSAPPSAGPISAGVHLIHDSHARLASYLSESPRAVVANLGFLPGGDPAVITRVESTLEALTESLRMLAVGGRMVVTLYIGHPGGMEEAAAVEALFRSLPSDRWDVLRLQAFNRPDSPLLVAADKRPARFTLK